jgi:hypothetical protein
MHMAAESNWALSPPDERGGALRTALSLSAQGKGPSANRRSPRR